MPATSWRLRLDWCQTFRSCKALRFQTKFDQSMIYNSHHWSCNRYLLFKRTLWPCQEREVPGICEVWLWWETKALWGWVDLGGSVSCDMVLSKLMSWEGTRAMLQKAIDGDKAWVFLNLILSSFKIYLHAYTHFHLATFHFDGQFARSSDPWSMPVIQPVWIFQLPSSPSRRKNPKRLSWILWCHDGAKKNKVNTFLLDSTIALAMKLMILRSGF